MKFELFQVDPYLKYEELHRNIYSATTAGFSSISLPTSLIPRLEQFLGGISTAAVIGYPNGSGTLAIKVSEIAEAYKCRATAIDLTVNHSLVVNEDWHAVSDEIGPCKILCDEFKLPLRVIIDFRFYENEQLGALLARLKRVGVGSLVISTGAVPDSLDDAAIFCAEIAKLGFKVIPIIYTAREKDIKIFRSAGVETLQIMNAPPL